VSRLPAARRDHVHPRALRQLCQCHHKEDDHVKTTLLNFISIILAALQNGIYSLFERLAKESLQI
jgi:hypothetical protein